MDSLKIFWKAFLTFFTIFSFSTISCAQSKFFNQNNTKQNLIQLSGFSEDDRIKLLILKLFPSGLTETAAEEIIKVLQQNIFNTNHFTVLGPEEWSLDIKNQNPTLADCRDIACGTMIGKLFRADKVLVGTLHSEMILNENGEDELRFFLSIRMVDTRTNVTNFSDEVQFNDLQMHDELFRLAARISENTMLIGKVLNTKNSGISLDIGRAQGMETGHQLVISSVKLNNTDSRKDNTNKSFQNIAIAEIVQVSDLSAEAVIVQKISAVSRGDQVQTYIDKEKLVRFISQTRKELDTQKRLKPKKRIIHLKKSIGKQSFEYEKWSKRYKKTKVLHDRWLYTTLGTGGATIFFLSGIIKTSGILEVLPWLAGAGAIYSGFRYLDYRELTDEIIIEGRSQGFISTSILKQPEGINWTPISNGVQISWLMKF